jgi:hypothetical protein
LGDLYRWQSRCCHTLIQELLLLEWLASSQQQTALLVQVLSQQLLLLLCVFCLSSVFSAQVLS